MCWQKHNTFEHIYHSETSTANIDTTNIMCKDETSSVRSCQERIQVKRVSFDWSISVGPQRSKGISFRVPQCQTSSISFSFTGLCPSEVTGYTPPDRISLRNVDILSFIIRKFKCKNGKGSRVEPSLETGGMSLHWALPLKSTRCRCYADVTGLQENLPVFRKHLRNIWILASCWMM